MPMIRAAFDRDLPALVELYNHYIRTTPITFDLEPFTVEARRSWFAQFKPAGRHRIIVMEEAGELIGYACTAMFRTKAAYDPSVETSVYLRADHTRRGHGARLYAALFELLKEEDIHRYYAGITLPNEPSLRLHRQFGFASVGVFTEVGRKFGRYWDVMFMERGPS